MGKSIESLALDTLAAKYSGQDDALELAQATIDLLHVHIDHLTGQIDRLRQEIERLRGQPVEMAEEAPRRVRGWIGDGAK